MSKMDTLFWPILLLCSALQVRAGFVDVGRPNSFGEERVVRELDVPGVTERDVNVTCPVWDQEVYDVRTLLLENPTCWCSGLSEQLIVLSAESTTGPEQPVTNPLSCPYPGACSLEVKRIQSFFAKSSTGDALFTLPEAVETLIGGWSWAMETSSVLASGYSCSMNHDASYATERFSERMLTVTMEPMFIRVTLLERLGDEPSGGPNNSNCRFVQYFLPQTLSDNSIKGILHCRIHPVE